MPPVQIISASITLWFMGLGFAMVLGVADRYVRHTQAWLVWPLALIVQTGKRWIRSLVRTVLHLIASPVHGVLRRIGHGIRHW